MKKSWAFLGLVLASVGTFLLSYHLAFARITGTQPSTPDALCAGNTSAESCIDGSGNVVPTTNNTQTLGSSSLRWLTMDVSSITAQSVAARAIAPTNTNTSRLHAVVTTTTSLLNVSVVQGDIYFINTDIGTPYAVCIASGTGTFTSANFLLYLSTMTPSGANNAKCKQV